MSFSENFIPTDRSKFSTGRDYWLQIADKMPAAAIGKLVGMNLPAISMALQFARQKGVVDTREVKGLRSYDRKTEYRRKGVKDGA